MARARHPGTSIARGHPLNRGRKHWWLALPNLSGGRRWFDMVGGAHATLTNMTTSASGWRTPTRRGGFGQLLLDGTDDYLTATGGVTSLPVTVTACFNAATTSSVILFNQGSTNGYRVALWGGAIRFSLGSVGDYLSALTFSANAWYFVAVAVTGAGGTATAYLAPLAGGPVLSESAAIGTPAATPATILLGAYDTSPSFVYGGALDSVSVYNRALPATEVSALLDQERRGYPGVLARPSSRTLIANAAAAGGGPWPWFTDNAMTGGYNNMGL